MKPVTKLARQGDILFIRKDTLPKGLKPSKDSILAHGEVTGHAHRVIEAEGVAVLETEKGDKYVASTKEWEVKHDEHGPVSFESGDWEARRQREYTPEAIRRVAD